MKKCSCRMGTLARPDLKTETRTGKSAHPTSRYDNSCHSPKERQISNLQSLVSRVS